MKLPGVVSAGTRNAWDKESTKWIAEVALWVNARSDFDVLKLVIPAQYNFQIHI